MTSAPDPYARLALLLRELRTANNMTQVDLAEKLKKPQSYVSKYEANERRLDLVEVREICVALGSSLETVVRLFEVADEA